MPNAILALIKIIPDIRSAVCWPKSVFFRFVSSRSFRDVGKPGAALVGGACLQLVQLGPHLGGVHQVESSLVRGDWPD